MNECLNFLLHPFHLKLILILAIQLHDLITQARLLNRLLKIL